MAKPEKDIDLPGVENFLQNMLPRAGQILRRYFHSENLESRKKGKLDFVTVADLSADNFIRSELSKNYPGIPVLTEETAPADFMPLLSEDYLWVVDPLDGTANFARGNSNFSISVALVSKGKPMVGALFAPISSRLFWARDGKDGAFWNGRNIHVSSVNELSESIICTDWSHILSTRDETTDFLHKVYGEVRQIKILGSAATDLTLLARGGVDIYHHVYLYPWDVAAAAFLAQKAGAVVTDEKGRGWSAFTPGILAANPVLHEKILNLLTAS